MHARMRLAVSTNTHTHKARVGGVACEMFRHHSWSSPAAINELGGLKNQKGSLGTCVKGRTEHHSGSSRPLQAAREAACRHHLILELMHVSEVVAADGDDLRCPPPGRAHPTVLLSDENEGWSRHDGIGGGGKKRIWSTHTRTHHHGEEDAAAVMDAAMVSNPERFVNSTVPCQGKAASPVVDRPRGTNLAGPMSFKDLASLNTFLLDKSYIEGYQFSPKDVEVACDYANGRRGYGRVVGWEIQG